MLISCDFPRVVPALRFDGEVRWKGAFLYACFLFESDGRGISTGSLGKSISLSIVLRMLQLQKLSWKITGLLTQTYNYRKLQITENLYAGLDLPFFFNVV
jgi:hypothetical protein